jgi:hypothetical protein
VGSEDAVGNNIPVELVILALFFTFFLTGWLREVAFYVSHNRGNQLRERWGNWRDISRYEYNSCMDAGMYSTLLYRYLDMKMNWRSTLLLWGLKSRWDPCFSNWHSSSIGSYPSPIFSRSPRSLVGVLRVTESFPVAGKMRPREMITTKPITSIRITKKWRYSCPIRIMKIADTVIITINHNPNHNYCYNTIPILIIILLSLSIISY